MKNWKIKILYLPIAPEGRRPRRKSLRPPPDAVQTSLMDEGASSEKKRQSSADGSQPPKKKPKTNNIELQGVPNDEVHPLLGVKGDGKSRKKQAGLPKGSKGKEKDSPFKQKLYKGTEVYLWKDQQRVKCRRSSASP